MTTNNHKTLEDLEREAYNTQNVLALEIYERWETKHGLDLEDMRCQLDRNGDELKYFEDTIDELNADLEKLQSQYDALAAEHAQIISPLDRNNEGA